MKGEGKIVIRFAVANPMAFCMGLQQQTTPTLPKVVNFSNLWSGKSLEFDPDSRNVVPSTFNVIDSAQLVDRIGGVNVLIGTVPLLHSSPESSIYTESAIKPWTDELNLLNHLLCGDPTFLCNLLGVAPLAYLTNLEPPGKISHVWLATQFWITHTDFSYRTRKTMPTFKSLFGKKPGSSSVPDSQQTSTPTKIGLQPS